MQIINNVTVGDQYTDPTTIKDVFNSNGGYFLIGNNDCFMQLQYNIQGQLSWTKEIHVPTGSGQIFPGTAGIRFRNFVAGSAALLSAALSENKEPSISIGSSGVANVGSSVAAITYRKVTPKTVAGTIVATDLLNGEITIGAGVMGTDKMLRLTAICDWLNNSGGTPNAPRIQLVLGGITLLDTNGVGAAVSSATRGPLIIEAEIQNLAAANAQDAFLKMFGNNGGGFGASVQANYVTGEGSYNVLGGSQLYAEGFGTGAVNTVPATALQLNVINGSNSAAYETKLSSALIEII